MPSPLTPDEQIRLDALWASICEYQGRRTSPKQLIDAADFVATGIPNIVQTLTDAAMLGFTGDVDEYGQVPIRGWVFRVNLSRDGEVWEKSYQYGAEEWRAFDWRPRVERPAP